MFSNEVWSIHGEDTVELAASVCDNDRMILDKWAQEREAADDDRNFLRFDREMRSNRGVCI